jgi:hypothetical protein
MPRQTTKKAARQMKITTGGQDGAAECSRMVLEKFDAATAAQTAVALALAGGKGVDAAAKLAMIDQAPRPRQSLASNRRVCAGGAVAEGWCLTPPLWDLQKPREVSAPMRQL